MTPTVKFFLLLLAFTITHQALAAANSQANTFTIEEHEILLSTIQKASSNAWSMMSEDHWCLPPFLGTLFLSEYYFEIHSLQWTNQSQFNTTHFTQLLLDTQLPDGSWKQVLQSNLESGNLDATIFNYWYLQSANPHFVEVSNKTTSYHPQMSKARDWILKNGGIEALQTMSQFKLAAYGLYPWEDLWYIPLFIFQKDSWFYAKNIVAQWVYPHLTALAYLRYHQTVFNDGTRDLSELWINYYNFTISSKDSQQTLQMDEDVLNLVQEMIELRRPLGSFGAYTISTLLSLLALKDLDNRYIQDTIPLPIQREVEKAMLRGFEFVEFNYFNYLVPYQGSLDDGRWWDTILMSWALLEASETSSNNRNLNDYNKTDTKRRLFKTMEIMLSRGVQPNGGIAYGLDFEYAPDADDTGLLILVLQYFGQDFEAGIELNDRWLHSMQNPDGGFPAFDKNKMGDSVLLQIPFYIAGITNSAEIFDPSSVDVTSHIIEGFGALGYTYQNDPVIAQAIEYIKNNQNAWGSWEARWGINQIYAVGCIVPALQRVGYDIKEEWVMKSLRWLISKQNYDGGFGETTLSYNFPEKYAGVGNSTVTQTAWGLIALIEVLDVFEQAKLAAEKAAKYLIQEFKNSGDIFVDTSVIGTGHRGVLYLQYPVYAYSFPLVALSRYEQYIAKEIQKQN